MRRLAGRGMRGLKGVISPRRRNDPPDCLVRRRGRAGAQDRQKCGRLRRLTAANARPATRDGRPACRAIGPSAPKGLKQPGAADAIERTCKGRSQATRPPVGLRVPRSGPLTARSRGPQGRSPDAWAPPFEGTPAYECVKFLAECPVGLSRAPRYDCTGVSDHSALAFQRKRILCQTTVYRASPT